MIFLLLIAMLGVKYIPGGPRPFFSIFGGDFFCRTGGEFCCSTYLAGQQKKKRGHIDFETIPALYSFWGSQNTWMRWGRIYKRGVLRLFGIHPKHKYFSPSPYHLAYSTGHVSPSTHNTWFENDLLHSKWIHIVIFPPFKHQTNFEQWSPQTNI